MEATKFRLNMDKYTDARQDNFLDVVRVNPGILKNKECAPALKNLAAIAGVDKSFIETEKAAIKRLKGVGIYVLPSEYAIQTIEHYVRAGAVTDKNLNVIAALTVEYTSLFRILMGPSPYAEGELMNKRIDYVIKNVIPRRCREDLC